MHMTTKAKGCIPLEIKVTYDLDLEEFLVTAMGHYYTDPTTSHKVAIEFSHEDLSIAIERASYRWHNKYGNKGKGW